MNIFSLCQNKEMVSVLSPIYKPEQFSDVTASEHPELRLRESPLTSEGGGDLLAGADNSSNLAAA